MPRSSPGSSRSSTMSSSSSIEKGELSQHFKKLPSHKEWTHAYLAASAYFLDPEQNPNTQYLIFEPKNSQGQLQHTFLYVFRPEGNMMYCLTDKSKIPNKDKINSQDTFIAVSREGKVINFNLASLSRPNIGLAKKHEEIEQVDLSHYATLSQFITKHPSAKAKGLSNEQRLLLGVHYSLALSALHASNIPHGNISANTLYVQQTKQNFFNVAYSDPRVAKDFNTRSILRSAADDILALGKIFEETLNLRAADVREMSSPSSANRPSAIHVAESLWNELDPDIISDPSLKDVYAEILRAKIIEAARKTVDEYLFDFHAEHPSVYPSQDPENILTLWRKQINDNKLIQKEKYDKHEPLIKQLQIIIELAKDLSNVDLAREFRERLVNSDERSPFQSASQVLQTFVLYLTNDDVYPDTALMILGKKLNELERVGKIADQHYTGALPSLPKEELPSTPTRRKL